MSKKRLQYIPYVRFAEMHDLIKQAFILAGGYPDEDFKPDPDSYLDRNKLLQNYAELLGYEIGDERE